MHKIGIGKRGRVREKARAREGTVFNNKEKHKRY